MDGVRTVGTIMQEFYSHCWCCSNFCALFIYIICIQIIKLKRQTICDGPIFGNKLFLNNKIFVLFFWCLARQQWTVKQLQELEAIPQDLCFEFVERSFAISIKENNRNKGGQRNEKGREKPKCVFWHPVIWDRCNIYETHTHKYIWLCWWWSNKQWNPQNYGNGHETIICGVVNLEVLGSLFHFLLLLFLPSIFTSSSIFHFGTLVFPKQ